jgi:hypothetical protein
MFESEVIWTMSGPQEEKWELFGTLGGMSAMPYFAWRHASMCLLLAVMSGSGYLRRFNHDHLSDRTAGQTHRLHLPRSSIAVCSSLLPLTSRAWTVSIGRAAVPLYDVSGSVPVDGTWRANSEFVKWDAGLLFLSSHSLQGWNTNIMWTNWGVT